MGVGLIRFVYPYVVPTMEKTLGISHVVMATVISCFFWADSVMRIVWGTLTDKLGTRAVTLCGLALLAAGFFIMSAATAVSGLSLGFGVAGMGAAALFILPAPLLSRWFGQRRRATAIGIATTAATVVTIVAGFVVPVVLANSPYNVIWRTEAIIVLGILAVEFFFLVNSPASKGLTPLGATEAELEALRAAPKGSPWGKESVLKVLKDKAFYQIAGSYFLFGVAYTGVLTFLSSYFQEIGWDPAAAGKIIALTGISGLVASLFWGAVGDRLAKRYVFGMSMGILGAGILLFAIGGQVPSIASLGALLFGFGGSGPVVMINAIQADYFAKNVLGTSFGLCAACFSIASAVSPIIGGGIADSTGTLQSAMFMGIIASAISATIISLMAGPRTTKMSSKQIQTGGRL
ncbi:MAG: MFS transporter [Firmicutes bacterium]|nr:MFS transporter [Bacillota bacterium]